MTATTRLRLAAYGRTHAPDALDGYTTAKQAKALRRWARINRHTVVGDVLFDHGVSRNVSVEDRPGLSRALDLVANNSVDGVLVPTIDRLAGELNVQEIALQVIWGRGGRVFTVEDGEVIQDDDTDPMRTFMRQIMGAARDLERGLFAKWQVGATTGCTCQMEPES